MGKFTPYNVPLKSLSEGVHEFEYHLGQQFFTDMENADVHDADLNVKLTVVHRAGKYELSFTVEGTVTLLCDRCLDDLIFPISTSYHTFVEYGDDYNDEADDMLMIPESDAQLNVAYMIYDTIVLAIPLKHVHPQGKCNRQMSALLRKHRARPTGEDAELEESLIDEMETMDDDSAAASDPRWNALKDFNTEE